ncbi:MAG: hypothetical protein ACK4ND_12910 [Cytophagaceae bacterium]
MKYFIISCVLIFCFSCGNSKYKDAKLEQLLKEKYHKDFVIKKNFYHFQLNNYQFEAILKENKEVKVFGSYRNDSSEIRDNYPQMLNNFQAKKWLNELLKKGHKYFLGS